jgi:hypothetical protein
LEEEAGEREAGYLVGSAVSCRTAQRSREEHGLGRAGLTAAEGVARQGVS